ncbi:MAG TPA: hypothetical protein VGI39_34375 [Polyangiaceae bacterium]|jgi:hypothetical protein
MNRSRSPRTARIGIAATIALAAAGVLLACASAPNSSEVTQIFTGKASYEEFHGSANQVGVQAVLAARCGTLDCHGSMGRPLRIFSQFGLRLVDDAGNVSGGAATTEAEIFADYSAAISVQPELTSKVFAGIDDPHVLLLLRKPLARERHKGGQVFQSGDDGDNCLSSWLSAQGVDYTACKNAASVP